MRRRSARFRFVLWMSILSTLFGTAVSAHRYGTQVDVLTDLPKVAIVIAIGCGVIAFLSWTFLQKRDHPSISRGVFAGAVTGLCVVPLPFFTSTYKATLMTLWRSGEVSVFHALFKAAPPAIETGLLTFVYVTKISIIAVVASAVVGAWISRSHN